MNSNDQDFSELQELLGLACEGFASESQLRRLQEVTSASPDAMQFYIDYLNQQAALKWWFSRTEGAPDELLLSETIAKQEGGELAPFPTPAAPNLTGAIPNVDLSALDPDSRLTDDGSLLSSWLRPGPILGFGTFLVVGLVLLIALIVRPNAKPQLDPVEMVYGRVNSVRLASGVTSLALDKVGMVTVEGPADFELTGPLRARLNQGRITVHVTEETGRGFTVETPDGEVVDFGTKFTLNVAQGSDTKLIVSEGTVDLRPGTWRQPHENDRYERLFGGQAVSFSAAGNIQRIPSVVTSRPGSENSPSTSQQPDREPLITAVFDDLEYPKFRNYYEIVPGGLQEDALAYVDREHQWNGVDENGIPKYLLGADYVKTFNSWSVRTLRDRARRGQMHLKVQLSRPAKLYVFSDDRLPPSKWLTRDFEPTGDAIALDAIDIPNSAGRKITPENQRHGGIGPGQSVDIRYSIWVREVKRPGVVIIDASHDPSKIGMYGIAATELLPDPADSASQP